MLCTKAFIVWFILVMHLLANVVLLFDWLVSAIKGIGRPFGKYTLFSCQELYKIDSTRVCNESGIGLLIELSAGK